MTFTDIAFRIITEAVLPGVSSVLSFIPTIAILIFILTLLRELGIVRTDLVPLFMGFSCSVPAIIACNTIPDKRRRYLTMFLIPYISCSAKLPIYVLLASVFFPAFPLAAVGSVYLVGILIASLTLLAARLSGFMQRAESPFVSQSARCRRPRFFFELRKPSFRVIFDAVAESCLGFVRKAFTVILAASVIIWLLQNLDTSLHLTPDISDSLLACFGDFLAPIFVPLGFGDRRAAAALLIGISSKESVVSTFAVLAGSAEKSALWMMLRDIFTPASAFSFMVFCLLYVPCIASLAAIRNVTGSIRTPLMVFVAQMTVAWCLSFLIFHSIKVII